MIDREEILAFMLAEYKNELNELSDDELMSHWQTIKDMKAAFE